MGYQNLMQQDAIGDFEMEETPVGRLLAGGPCQGQIAKDDARRFLLAGNATVTFKSLKTGQHYTYKVQAPKQPRPGGPTHFVKLLTGPNNTADFTYLGAILPSTLNQSIRFTATKATKAPGAPSFKAFAYVFGTLFSNLPLAGVEIWHEGSCGRCGRALTVPESIERGIGPECAAIMGGN